jgi:hypothetical protein
LIQAFILQGELAFNKIKHEKQLEEYVFCHSDFKEVECAKTVCMLTIISKAPKPGAHFHYPCDD